MVFANLDVSIDINIGQRAQMPWLNRLRTWGTQTRVWFQGLDKNQMGAIVLCAVGGMYYIAGNQRQPALVDEVLHQQQHQQQQQQHQQPEEGAGEADQEQQPPAPQE